MKHMDHIMPFDLDVELPHAKEAHKGANVVLAQIRDREHKENMKLAREITQKIKAAIAAGKYSISLEYRPNNAIYEWLENKGYKITCEPPGWGEECYKISFEHAIPEPWDESGLSA